MSPRQNLEAYAPESLGKSNPAFEQAKISLKNFQLWLFRGNNQIFSQQTNFKDMVDV